MYISCYNEYTNFLGIIHHCQSTNIDTTVLFLYVFERQFKLKNIQYLCIFISKVIRNLNFTPRFNQLIRWIRKYVRRPTFGMQSDRQYIDETTESTQRHKYPCYLLQTIYFKTLALQTTVHILIFIISCFIWSNASKQLLTHFNSFSITHGLSVKQLSNLYVKYKICIKIVLTKFYDILMIYTKIAFVIISVSLINCAYIFANELCIFFVLYDLIFSKFIDDS